MSGAKRFPEETDLVSVTIKGVEYYGYVDKVDYDLRSPGVRVEFLPGTASWFDMGEVMMVRYPQPA